MIKQPIVNTPMYFLNGIERVKFTLLFETLSLTQDDSQGVHQALQHFDEIPRPCESRDETASRARRLLSRHSEPEAGKPARASQETQRMRSHGQPLYSDSGQCGPHNRSEGEFSATDTKRRYSRKNEDLSPRRRGMAPDLVG